MVDTKLRTLTIEDSKTNRAHAMWYSQMNWKQRGEVLDRPEIAAIKGMAKRFCAAINWVEDNLVS